MTRVIEFDGPGGETIAIAISDDALGRNEGYNIGGRYYCRWCSNDMQRRRSRRCHATRRELLYGPHPTTCAGGCDRVFAWRNGEDLPRWYKPYRLSGFVKIASRDRRWHAWFPDTPTWAMERSMTT